MFPSALLKLIGLGRLALKTSRILLASVSWLPRCCGKTYALICILFVTASVGTLLGQDDAAGNRASQGPSITTGSGGRSRSIGSEIARRIQTQGSLIEAQRRREIAFARAREEYGEAKLRIDQMITRDEHLGLKELKSYWEKRRINNLEQWNELERQIENARKPMVLEQARKVAVWERTIEGELARARPSIHSGALLNRIAQQVDLATSLSSSTIVSKTITDRLATIDASSLSKVRLQISSFSGPVSVSLTGSVPPIFQRWPYFFRDPRLRQYCYAINKAAAGLVAPETTATDKYELEQSIRNQIEALSNAFYRTFPRRATIMKSNNDARRFYDAERFLGDIERSIANLAETDASGLATRPSYFAEYEADNRNAATLIQYTMRYGLKFDQAPPGAEHIYDRLFLQFRDLARELEAAPRRDEITKPMINLDLDDLIKDAMDRKIDRVNFGQ